MQPAFTSEKKIPICINFQSNGPIAHYWLLNKIDTMICKGKSDWSLEKRRSKLQFISFAMVQNAKRLENQRPVEKT